MKPVHFSTQGRKDAKTQKSKWPGVPASLRLGVKTGLAIAALFVLSSCNLAGSLPEGPVTPLVPPPGAAATRSALPTTAPAVATMPAVAQPAVTPVTQPTGQASIAGTLVNGTAGAKAPGNQPLTLYAITPDRSEIMFTRTVTSDATGQFVFDQLDVSPAILYGIQTQYQKAYYTSNALTFAHGGLTLTVPITVYETTTDVSGVHVDQMHIFFDFVPGHTTVGQLFIVSNMSDRAYIAADGTSLRFPLPPGATNIRFQDGELGDRYRLVPDGVADTEGLAPGTGSVQTLFSYDLPYDGKKLDMNLALAYPVKNVNVLVPEGGIKLNSAQLTAAGVRPTQDGNMLNYVGGSLAAGQSLVLQLTGAPDVTPTGEAATASSGVSPVLIIGAALLVVAVGIVAVVWLRQQRVAEELEQVQDPEARREELVDTIAALDDDFEAGHVHEVDYRRERAALKAELVELMKQDGETR